MTKTETHLVPVEVDLSEIEHDTISAAAKACGQTVEEFMQTTGESRRPKPRVVLAPPIAVPGFPFFRPIGQGAM